MFLLFVLPLLFPQKHLLLSWNLRVKDLSTCALALALVASVCSLHEDSWKLKFEKLVTLGCIVFPRACASWVHCVP